MKKLLLSFAFILMIQVCKAQLQGRFQSISVDEGLAQNTVWDVLQDYRGYLWISTADGISRFDGHRFSNYKHQSTDSTTTGGVTLYSFSEDFKKELWISHNKGLDRYDRALDRFERIYKSDYPCTILDSNEPKLIWILDGSTKVVSVDKSSHKVLNTIFIDSIPSPIESLRNSIRYDDKFYFIESFCLFIVDIKNNTVEKIKASKNLFGAIYQLNNDEFVTYIKNYFFVYNIKSKTSRFVLVKSINQGDIPSTFFSIIKWNNKLFGGSAYGMLELDLENFSLKNITQNFSGQNGNSYPYVQSITLDKSNNLYIGTNGNGLKVYSPYQNKFGHYTTQNPKTNLTKSIYVSPNGKIMVGVYGEELIVFENAFQFDHKRFSDISLISTVKGIKDFGNDRAILFCDDNIVLYNYVTNNAVYQKKYKETVFGFPYIYKKSNNRWVFNKIFEIVEVDSLLNELSSIRIPGNDLITFFIEKDSTEIWIGSNQKLIVYNKVTGKFKDTPIKAHIKHILITNSGRYFVSTTNGLIEILDNFEVIKVHNEKTGLPSEFIYGALEDDLGYVWFSHNKGLTRLNITNNAYNHFSLKDGLQSNEFNTGAFYKDEKGLLYFGGVNGVNVIDPKNIPINQNPPQIAINEINLGDTPYVTDSSYNEIKNLILNHTDNTLSFDFSALEFSQPGQNTYAYLLEGYDQQWIESGTKHFARYANLPPGNYTFKIKAANGDGVWTIEPREISITIIPPVWQRLWFIVMASFVGLIIIALGIKYFIRKQSERLRQELEVQHKLELERIRISRDLHDNVGAQLSYLITNMEWMAEHPEELDAAEEKKRLKSLSEAGRQAILTLRQTIWAISQNALTVEEFADRYKQYVLKMVEFNKQIHVKFEEHIDTDTQLSPALALNLFRVCQEAFNNALKHSGANHILIQFYSDKHKVFKYIITDDGLGFDYENAINNGHYGLKNMKARAEESHARLSFETKPGKGTTLTLEI